MVQTHRREKIITDLESGNQGLFSDPGAVQIFATKCVLKSDHRSPCTVHTRDLDIDSKHTTAL